jgi:hypothetical protein
MKKYLQILMLLSLFGLFGLPCLAEAEALEDIKTRMALADCCRFEFITILENEVFDAVDTTEGVAYIASDGQYRLAIGPDEYLRTVDKLYIYATENNQVTIERAGPTSPAEAGISFITRLDSFYQSEIVEPGKQYRLERLDEATDNLPKLMTLFLSADAAEFERLEYLDQNDELNRIVFKTSVFLSECDRSVLEPRYPDSTEMIKLY